MGVLGAGIAGQAGCELARFIAIHATPLVQELHHFFIRRHNAGEAADLRRHVGHGGALIHAQRLDGLAGVFHHLGQRLAAADVIHGQQRQNKILGGDVGPALAADDHLHRLRHLHAHVFGDPGIKNVGSADAEGHAAHRAQVRRVRIGAHVELAGQRIGFRHQRMADPLRAFAVAQLAVQLDALRLGEFHLLQLELRGQVEQAHLFLFFRDHIIQKREMVAEKQDGRLVVHRRVFADVVLVEDRGHGRDVFVAEAKIGAGKPGVAGFHVRHANFRLRRFFLCGVGALARVIQHVPRKNLLSNRHRTFSRRDGREEYFALHARHVERKQPAVFDDLAGDVIFAGGELAERNLLPGADLIDERKIRGSEHPQVLAVLLVDALDVFRDHQLDAGRHFRIRRLLPAGAFAAPLAAHRGDKTTFLYFAALDGELRAAFQPGVRKLAQRLIEEEADVRRGDLVGGDVVAQLGIFFRMARVPGQIFARQLPLDERRIFSQKQDPARQLHPVGQLADLAAEQRVRHR